MNPNLKVYKTPTGHYIFSADCIMCKIPQAVTVQPNEFNSWQHGAFVQNAFPKHDANDREFLVSGICGKCFDKMFEDAE